MLLVVRKVGVPVKRWRGTFERGVAAVEMAILTPLLILMLVGVMEGGTFLQEHLSVVNAAREGARFKLDGGSDAELLGLVRSTTRGLPTSDPNRYSVWIITGQINGASMTQWNPVKLAGPASETAPSLTAAAARARFIDCNTGADPCELPANLRFLAVEVGYRHDALFSTLTLPTGNVTLRSYSILRRL
jgi:TadE-like protein